jgi:hypothetical protein
MLNKKNGGAAPVRASRTLFGQGCCSANVLLSHQSLCRIKLRYDFGRGTAADGDIGVQRARYFLYQETSGEDYVSMKQRGKNGVEAITFRSLHSISKSLRFWLSDHFCTWVTSWDEGDKLKKNRRLRQ